MEDAGAAMAIIIDDRQENINEIVLSNDGSGYGIRIPSLIISQDDG